MALTPVDRSLLHRCLVQDTGAWNDFVDRFLGLVYHVIHYTGHLRSQVVSPEEVEDIAQEIMTAVVADDFAILRQFRGTASLAAYLTVIARRICIRELMKRHPMRPRENSSRNAEFVPEQPALQAGMERFEEVERLLKILSSRDREVVRLHYLEGRSYEEISAELDIPVNTIGPTLTRARERLRKKSKRTAG